MSVDPSDAKVVARKVAAKKRVSLSVSSPDADKHLALYADDLIRHYGVGNYAGYMPINSELSPIALMMALGGKGASLSLPCTPPPGQALAFYRWQAGAPLRDGRYGTQEPDQAAPMVRPNVILVPLLAFDDHCWRLGYGGGYYDRTLGQLRHDGAPLIAVGIAYAGQKLDKVPVGAYDVPLDAVLCPTGLIHAP